jgi:hypothetical protein
MITPRTPPTLHASGTPSRTRGRAWAPWVCAALFALTVGQLLVATLAPDLPQFSGKGFGARLALYPVMMLAAPVSWWVASRRVSSSPSLMPWWGFAWIMLPFLVDVTGNTADLYDSIGWWDDANHFVNWFCLSLGAGLLLVRAPVALPGWLLALLVTGVGAAMAIGWELGEYTAFIRANPAELATAYTDTLGDEALGTLGAALAGLTLTRLPRRIPSSADKVT